MSAEYNPKSNVIFGDVDLSDYNAFAIYCNIFDRPERDVEVVSVPGRNGDLIFDNGRYKNLDRVYTIQVTGVQNVHNLINALTTKLEYQELEDEYDDTVYYVARLKNRPRVSRFVGNAVLLTVTFDRKPQTFLKSGRDTAITGTYIGKVAYADVFWGGTWKIAINNPYSEKMYPKIVIRGNQPSYFRTVWVQQIEENFATPPTKQWSSVTIGALDWSYGDYKEENNIYIKQDMTRSDVDTTIDSELRSITYGSGYNPDRPTYPDYTILKKFPILNPGNNYLYFTFGPYHDGGENYHYESIISPQIYPRWWTI